MTVVLIAAGIVVFGSTVIDITGSLLGDSGTGGWVTGRGGRLVWSALAPSRRRQRHGPSRIAGRLIVLGTPLVWLAGLWAGWSLIFLADPGSVVTTAATRPAGAIETIYFTGYTLFTLGNGELQPVGGPWQIATAVAAFSGFAVVSLAVTYIIPVVQAATIRRRIAGTISLYGGTPAALSAALDGRAADHDRLAVLVMELTETHAAFPALHYLHSTDETRSAPAMIANLGLALGAPADGDTARGEAALDATVPAAGRLRAAIGRYLRLHPPVHGPVDPDWDEQLELIRLDDGRAPASPAGMHH